MRLSLTEAKTRHLSLSFKLSYGHAKLLTLFAFIAAIYWEDVQALYNLMVDENRYPVALAALGAIGVYAFLKSEVLGKTLNVGSPNTKAGLALFVSSVIIYLVGSYSFVKLFFHTVSLTLFMASYLAIRINGLTIRVFLPALAILPTLSLLTTVEPFETAASAILLAALASSALLFLNLRLNLKLSIVVANALFYFALEAISLPDQVLLALAFSEALAIWLALRRWAFLVHVSDFEEQAKGGFCHVCGSDEDVGDFCPFCGRVLVRETPRFKFEILGLALFLVFLASSLFISVPVLIEGSGGIVLNYLRAQGSVQQTISFSSYDWLTYERCNLNSSEQGMPDSFAFKEVLVPERFPETKNYTLIFESAPREPRTARSWRFAPWKVQKTQNVLLRGSIPATYYEISSKNASLKVVVWMGKINLLVGENLITKAVGISVLRNYTSSAGGQNVTYASDLEATEFLKDAERISFNEIRELMLASSWSHILFSARSFLLLVSDVLLVAVVIVFVTGVAISASKKLDAESYFLEVLPKDKLRVLLAVDRLTGSKVPATGENVLREVNRDSSAGVLDAQMLLKTLDGLEALGLVKRRVRLGARTAILEWRLAF